MAATLWEFHAVDTLFFRESRPMESIGGAQLASRFPPPARTLAGAIRTLIGEAHGVDWFKWGKNEVQDYPELKRQIGFGDEMGSLTLTGPFPMKDGQRLYPAPLLLAKAGDRYVRLQPGDPVDCDLGRVRLPALTEPIPGAKPLEADWISAADLGRVLSGGLPEKHIGQQELFEREPRLGLTVDQAKRSAEKGLLYQTEHLRLNDGVTLGLGVAGAAEIRPTHSMIRLGGEGRMASVNAHTELASLPRPAPKPGAKGIILVLLTATDFHGGWTPPGFVEGKDEQGCDVWKGDICGVSLTIKSAIVGKAAKEGGWDLAKRQSRPIKSLVPAGSCYFCEVAGSADEAIAKIAGTKIGTEQELGRGEVAVGYWI